MSGCARVPGGVAFCPRAKSHTQESRADLPSPCERAHRGFIFFLGRYGKNRSTGTLSEVAFLEARSKLSNKMKLVCRMPRWHAYTTATFVYAEKGNWARGALAAPDLDGGESALLQAVGAGIRIDPIV